jgi:hypothetical protein
MTHDQHFGDQVTHGGGQARPDWQPVGVDADGRMVEAMPLGAWVARAGAPHALYSTQAQLDDLAEEIADTLDNAMHLEACYVRPDETRCVCVIGKLRAVLPRCGHVDTINRPGPDGVLSYTRECLRTVHPSAAHKHVYGEV